QAQVDDAVGLPGTGLIAFGSLPFDPQSPAPRTLRVPAVIVGRRGDRSWVTRIVRADEPDPSDGLPVRTEYGPYWSASLGPGALDHAGYQAAVRGGLAAIA